MYLGTECLRFRSVVLIASKTDSAASGPKVASMRKLCRADGFVEEAVDEEAISNNLGPTVPGSSSPGSLMGPDLESAGKSTTNSHRLPVE
jgi:hypothetical protein